MRVLTWNLFHGRSIPNAGRGLLDEFATALAGWEWDVALLQEVPPWWPPALALATGAQQRSVLTSRNWGCAARRAVSSRNPDLLKANGGGCNAILVRGGDDPRPPHAAADVAARAAVGARRAAGRRDAGSSNLHAHARRRCRGRGPTPGRRPRPRADWAGGAPLVLGGDLNLRGRPELPGLTRVAGHFVDHVFVAGLEARGPARGAGARRAVGPPARGVEVGPPGS